MEQVQKAAVAIKALRLILIMCALLIFINKAQSQDNDFQLNFVKKLKYPESLKNTCTATFTNLLIDVSEQGTITDVTISDSAPQHFKEEFEKIKSSLNKDLLLPVIKSKGLKNCGILIPVFYVFTTDYCVNSFEPVGYIANNYLNFNGRTTNKLVYILKPIIGLLYKPIY